MDVGYQIATFSYLQGLARAGKAIVAVLHDLNLVAGFADKVVLMHQGRIAARGNVQEVLESKEIDAVYGATFQRFKDPKSGRVVLVPEILSERQKTLRPRRVHLIGGGGSAAALLTELWQTGHRPTLGVTHELDSDCDAARRVGIEFASAQPFHLIDDEDVALATQLGANADVVIVTGAPYGPGNKRNLEVAGALQSSGKPVFLIRHRRAEWDFTGGEATQKWQLIQDTGGVMMEEGEVLDALEKLP
jgi:iron complex transport system ATP-binding protein